MYSIASIRHLILLGSLLLLLGGCQHLVAERPVESSPSIAPKAAKATAAHW